MKIKGKKIICLLLTLIMLLSTFSVCMSALASGSSHLNVKDSNDKGSRFFSEYIVNEQVAGVDRRTMAMCYLFANETAYFGSSVCDSRLDIDDKKQSTETGCDIIVKDPDGNKTSYDVIKDGAGYISNSKQEKNGPKINGSTSSEYYTPLSFTATKEGTYTFYFHSQLGTKKSPGQASIDADGIGKQGESTVAYWDVSVATKVNNYEEIKTGRTWTNFLSLSTGSDKPTTYANLEVYVLTNDGYIYRVKFKDIVPFGFVFFANNMGFTTTGHTPYSIYHSVYDSDNNLKYITSEEYVTIHKPHLNDSGTAKTFKIFFEKPNEDLKGKIYNDPASNISGITNIRFEGISTGSMHHGQGGKFTFKSYGASTATITIDFRDEIERMKETAGENWTYDGSGIVELSGAVKDGDNSFDWNGEDTAGKLIPVGTYSKTNIHTVAEAKGGEIHFPFIDVEGIYGGVEIERLNGSEDGKYDIYYNNNPLVYKTIEGAGVKPVIDGKYVKLSDETRSYNGSSTLFGEKYFKTIMLNGVEKEITQKNISTLVADSAEYLYELENGKGTWNSLSNEKKQQLTNEYSDFAKTYHHEPNNSTVDTIIFSNENRFGTSNADGYYGGGNQAAIDVWTYYKADTKRAQMSADLQILPSDDVGTISGRIFYDENNNQKYDENSNDYPLHNLEVELVYENGTPVTKTEYGPTFDSDGFFIRDDEGDIIFNEHTVTYKTTTNENGVYTFKGVPVDDDGESYYVHVLLNSIQVNIEGYNLTTTDINSSTGGPDGNKRDNKGKAEIDNSSSISIFDKNNSQSATLTRSKKDCQIKDIGYNTTILAGNQANYKVSKQWHSDGTYIPNNITVKLFYWDQETNTDNEHDGINVRTGKLIDTVKLSSTNGWTYTWRHLDKTKPYYVIEYYTLTDDEGNILYNDRGEERLAIIGGTLPFYSNANDANQLGSYSFFKNRPVEYINDNITHQDGVTEEEKQTNTIHNSRLYDLTYTLTSTVENNVTSNNINLVNYQTYDEKQYYVWLDHETSLPNFISKTAGYDEELMKNDIISDDIDMSRLTITALDSDAEIDDKNVTSLFKVDPNNSKNVLFTAKHDSITYPEGTGTRTYKVEYNSPNDNGDTTIYSWTLTIHVYDVKEDKYVLDYGLKALLQEAKQNNAYEENPNKDMVLSNDVLRVDRYKNALDRTMNTCADFTGISYSPNGELNNLDEIKALTYSDTFYNDANGHAVAEGKYGKIDVDLTKHRHEAILEKGDDHAKYAQVKYTPTSIMSGIDVFYYRIILFSETIANKFTDYNNIDASNGVIMYAPIIIVPANTVYYENNQTISNEYSGDYILDISKGPQDIYQSIDQSENYGYDEVYVDPDGVTAGQYDSLGNSSNIEGKSKKFIFEFSGTGFDIVGRTDSTTAKITYRLDKFSEEDGKYKLYKMGTIDASYQDESNSILYQLPVVSIKNLDYNKYKVTAMLSNASVDNCHFNFDGVKIYNPLGLEGNEYYLPSEQNANIYSIRDMILGNVTEADLINGFVPNEKNMKAVLISSEKNEDKYLPGSTLTEVRTSSSIINHSEDLRDYLSTGPKGELYLPAGSGIAFTLSKVAGEENKTLQLEAKAIYDGSAIDETRGYGSLEIIGTSGGNEIIPIHSSTAMYYELDTSAITNTNDKFILINNSNHTISLTNIKCKGYEIRYPENLLNPVDTKNYATPVDNWNGDQKKDENIVVLSPNFATSFARENRQTYLNVTILEPINEENRYSANATFSPYINGERFTGSPIRHFKTNYNMKDENGDNIQKAMYAFVYKVPVTPTTSGDASYTIGAVKADESVYSSNAWNVSIEVKSENIEPEVTQEVVAQSYAAPRMMRAMLLADEAISTDDEAWHQDGDNTIYADYSEEGEYEVVVKDIDGYESVVTFQIVMPEEDNNDNNNPDTEKSFIQKLIDIIRSIVELIKKLFNI